MVRFPCIFAEEADLCWWSVYYFWSGSLGNAFADRIRDCMDLLIERETENKRRIRRDLMSKSASLHGRSGVGAMGAARRRKVLITDQIIRIR